MLYDITQPLFECQVYPGDEAPRKIPVRRMEQGEEYNLTSLHMCVHNGTHVDAPCHFLADGKGIDRLGLEKFIGPAYVAQCTGNLDAQDAARILRQAADAYPGAQKKLLMKRQMIFKPMNLNRKRKTRNRLILKDSALNPRPLGRRMHPWRFTWCSWGRRLCRWRESGWTRYRRGPTC